MSTTSVNENFNLILSKFTHVKKTSTGYLAHCPAHDDKQSSLSLTLTDDGKILIKCFAGCSAEAIVEAIGLELKDLFPPKGGGEGGNTSQKSRATVQRSSEAYENKGEKDRYSHAEQESVACNSSEGCTLQQYATLKGLSIPFLRGLGLSDMKYLGVDAVRIPYHNAKGEEVAVQFRIALQGDDKFRWRKGSKPLLYGLNRDFKSRDFLILCEGPSDAQTLWFNGYPALGLPSADSWKEEKDAPFLDGIDSIFVVIEPDQGGVAVQKWLGASRIRDRVRLLSLDGHKDPSELFLHDRENFKTSLQKAMAKAVPWPEMEAKQAATERDQAWAMCRFLAEDKNILSKFARTIERLGVAGESGTTKLLYLTLTSRHQKKPVSGSLKGPSAAGKSFIVDQVLRFFPPSSYYALTSMSEHALAYSQEPLKCRYLILFEAAGISNDFANYLLRSLLSEGCIKYETVEKTADGMKPRLIEREGPTGTIITTTQVRLHPENETRLLSITVSDTPEQTKNVLLALSEEEGEADLTQWQALQRWIDLSEHRVVIPYSRALAERIPPIAVRLRRDFTQILGLIRSHAILCQAMRQKDSNGRIIAAIEDYAVARELVADVVSDGVGATVSQTIRETVEAAKKIIESGEPTATVQRCAMVLGIDKSSASRRIRVAIEKGYLVNTEKQRGKPARIVLGDPLPENLTILPHPEELNCCSVADEMEGINIPPPPPEFEGDLTQLPQLMGYFFCNLLILHNPNKNCVTTNYVLLTSLVGGI